VLCWVVAAWCCSLFAGADLASLFFNKLKVRALDLPDLGSLTVAGMFGGSTAGSQGQLPLPLARLGGEVKKLGLLLLVVHADPRCGSLEAAPGSASTTVLRWPPSKWVGRRPLPPSSSATALPGRRQQVFINLQAKLPFRRPLCSSVEGSRCPTPSGLVPGGVVLICATSCSIGVVGAGPDGVFSFLSRVLCAKVVDLFVIFASIVVLLVIVPPFNECF
jgi:hypothetical protein